MPATCIDADDNGMLFLNSSVRLSDVADGQQYTILVGEIRDGGKWQVGSRMSLRNTGTIIDTKSDTWTLKKPGLQNPQADDEDTSDVQTRPDPLTAVGGFGSFHSAVSNFLMVDGAVRPIGDSIDTGLFQHLGNRRDGKIVNDF